MGIDNPNIGCTYSAMGKQSLVPLNQGQLKLRVRELRIERKWTQFHLAKLSGTTEASICIYERGHNLPSLDCMVKMMVAFGLTSLDSLLEIDLDSVRATLNGSAPSVTRPAAEIVKVEIPGEEAGGGSAADGIATADGQPVPPPATSLPAETAMAETKETA